MNGGQHGLNRLFLVDATGLWTPEPVAVAYNTRQVAAGWLIAACVGLRDPNFAVNCVYLEYANVADPAAPVAAPSFATTDGRAYYDNLASTPDRDYLRVPLSITPTISIVPGQEAYFAAGTGNVVTWFAQSAGTVGANGKPFSSAANSKLYGVALVAAPVLGDRSRDVLLARSYYDAGGQQVKPPGGQFGVQYSQPFA
jgi:hypothetical protein